MNSGSLDITFYRDDLTRLSKHPVVAGNDIAFSIEDKKIILVDDVLYSGTDKVLAEQHDRQSVFLCLCSL